MLKQKFGNVTHYLCDALGVPVKAGTRISQGSKLLKVMAVDAQSPDDSALRCIHEGKAVMVPLKETEFSWKTSI